MEVITFFIILSDEWENGIPFLLWIAKRKMKATFTEEGWCFLHISFKSTLFKSNIWKKKKAS